jgi:hypothetical protein
MEVDIINTLITILALVVAGIFLTTLAWNLWLTYVYSAHLKSVKWVLLEVRPPKEVFKSPLAMELVLNTLYQTGGIGTWYDRYWKGQLRSFFSLEIASLEGKIHFYIRTPEKFRKLIESQIYAQYPQAEVGEVQDYTSLIPGYEKGAYGMWGGVFGLAKDDPYPIRTYVDYGLDRAVGALKEEERIDPLTPTLEFMGSIGAGEYVWLQILVRADTKRFKAKNKDGVEVPGMSWKDKAKDLANDLREKLNPKPKEGEPFSFKTATKGQLAVIEAIERSTQKFGFDCGIRAMYIGMPGFFDANRIQGVLGMLRQYDNGDLNSFKLIDKTGVDLPWQDITKQKVEKMKKDTMWEYKNRSYFYSGFDFKKLKLYFTNPDKNGRPPFILNSEELATLFHLPGRVVETPTFTRIEAAKAEPPPNLPM